MKHGNTLIAGMCVALLVTAGCVPSGPEPEDSQAAAPQQEAGPAEEQPTSKESLVRAWQALAQEPAEAMSSQQTVEIGKELTALGGDALDPLFSVLESEEAAPSLKVLVVVTLENWVNPSLVPRLEPLLESEREPTTRSCAAHLLAQIEDEASKEILEQYVDDDEPRVRMAAMQGLARMGSDEYVQPLLDIYEQEGASVQEQNSIVLVVAGLADPEYNEFLEQAVQNKELKPDVRAEAVRTLGEIGDPSVIPMIEGLLEDPSFEDYTFMAEAALEVLRTREEMAEAESQTG